MELLKVLAQPSNKGGANGPIAKKANGKTVKVSNKKDARIKKNTKVGKAIYASVKKKAAKQG